MVAAYVDLSGSDDPFELSNREADQDRAPYPPLDHKVLNHKYDPLDELTQDLQAWAGLRASILSFAVNSHTPLPARGGRGGNINTMGIVRGTYVSGFIWRAGFSAQGARVPGRHYKGVYTWCNNSSYCARFGYSF
ncbi:hypothetical protein B0T26DRAFT_753000 [Lasiosphaeria miniovina]|uniref:Uncharacterized protein n=1 Tax=Lasiosphaeria miniovina TaxID=1954250 RepID=A0AA40ABR1_9PEZI|nr:uncharacterized protein B0T26DRAFT_753000 [Lasiosphaeria miniovina]KAK0712810.1 hypothetical protein B0T26DRAFT_753000 [Lasiosphaeria miniovina]